MPLGKLWMKQWANSLKRFVCLSHYEELELTFLQVEVSLAVLWEGARDNPQQLKVRAEIIQVVEAIQQQIQFWTSAQKFSQATKDFIAMDED